MGDRSEARVSRFVGHLEPARALAAEAVAELARELDVALERAREAWPDLDIDDGAFLEYLARRIHPDEEPAARARSAHVADLFLACGCAGGVTRAIESFKSKFLDPAVGDLVKLGIPPDIAEETVHDSQVELLVGGEEGRRIADYRGAGRLRAWLRTRHLREAIRRRNRRERERSLDESALEEQPPPIPQMARAYEHEVYLPALREALSIAMQRLSPRQRNLLRQRYLYGFGLERLAALYRVHHSTVGRWVQAAEAQVARYTRRDLRQRCGLTDSECDSVLGMLYSQREVSIRGALGPDLECDS